MDNDVRIVPEGELMYEFNDLRQQWLEKQENVQDIRRKLEKAMLEAKLAQTNFWEAVQEKYPETKEGVWQVIDKEDGNMEFTPVQNPINSLLDLFKNPPF